MKRQHHMPWGTRHAAASTMFRFWAPAAQEVLLHLETGAENLTLPMQRTGLGWFERSVDSLAPGCRYRFQADCGLLVPDPASRSNPDGVHAASELIDPAAFDWQDDDWRGRPWHEAVLYEVHTGSFSPEGNFAGIERRLDHLADLGVTALQLMPVAATPGRRNWGYDGVLAYAPAAAYGPPQALKSLVQSAHRRGIMVLLDVVYNHFGPEGNYLHVYARDFFTDRHRTPWGAAIDFEGARAVRDFYVHNALYWLEEFHLDGLRLDAVHAIHDGSDPDIVEQIARAVAAGPGRTRHVHVVLENDDNAARRLSPGNCTAQWNDDFHHCLHVLLSGEQDGYYSDYAPRALQLLGRTLAEGYAWQGEASPYRGGQARGEPSAHLAPTCFVNFLQNHDQIGNRALGERLTEIAAPRALRAALEILLLAPSVPMLFMGEEWGTQQRFAYFCDFGEELAAAVRNGRLEEFSRFARFSDPTLRAQIPDPGADSTFAAACLDWSATERAEHRATLDLVQKLLALRRTELMPRLAGMAGGSGRYRCLGASLLEATWRLADGSPYRLLANLGPQAATPPAARNLRLLHASDGMAGAQELPGWSVSWWLGDSHESE
ncbi:MAG: malto-oligosyltrehalose trehalohydrolase [Rhodocyclaceae bacterium]|nr:malto-oligosyltrehalose trehalohydrolase [Rhodocyclaceae bacterium]MBX3670202.1 malto-oligosyltrehalose trehalohydrolase [Rhodocyclaceae bacterium]